MNLAAYLRFSTNNQDELTQRSDLEQWAKQEQHTIAAWFIDEGISGKEDLGVRVALGEALAAAVSGLVDGVVVQRLDRLARDLVVQEQLLREFWGCSAVVCSTDAGENPLLVEDDDREPSRTMVRQILGAVAEYERKMIRLRMMSGLARKRAAGGYAGGRPPYGFKAEGAELVPIPAEQRVVRRIRELRAAGGSLRDIAEVLNSEGVSRPDGGLWRSESVRRVLGMRQAGPPLDAPVGKRQRVKR